MAVVVAKVGRAGWPLWAELRARLWDDMTPAGHLAEIERILRDGRLSAYLATAAGAAEGAAGPIGFAEIALRDYANGCSGRPVPFLEGIWVDPGHRRRGVGAALIEAVIGDIRRQGYRELCSDAELGNLTSHRAHAGWGFDEVERVVCFRRSLE